MTRESEASPSRKVGRFPARKEAKPAEALAKAGDGTVRVFSARACAAPLEKAAGLFEKQTGIHVEISVCSRHCARPVAEEATGTTGGDDFLNEIAEAGIHDLAIGGAEYLLDDGEVRGIVRRHERRTIAYRRSAILVPTGNPAHIRSVKDMTRPGVRVGISVIDCLKGLWEDVAGRLGLLEAIRPNITYHANGCIAIVEAVAQGIVDGAFGWTAFEHLAPGRIEIIEMPRNQEILRGTGVGLLTFARELEPARRFMDFLTSPEARACYEEFGWVIGKR
jgi:accessory colonization factor AcfC